MGCLGWVLIAPFVGLGFAAIKAVNHFIKKGKKPLGILISILLGGISLGLGYDLAYVGWTEYEGLTPLSGHISSSGLDWNGHWWRDCYWRNLPNPGDDKGTGGEGRVG
jgi:hypothetical protein